ncbi:ParB N-terminal domain-containing protein [Vibrio owensii]|uniref:ParB/Srx family N-terminal domain-containing protein n=1 Tax=Vibrio owensii TaxID=696485 RepID=UPI00339866A3
MAVSKSEKEWLKKVSYETQFNPKQIRMPHNVPLMNVEELVPYENNVKIHTHEQVGKICASIDADGLWTSPIIVDGSNVIIAGHGRRLAALHYGLAKVPVIKLEDITPEKANQLRIADNKVAEGEIDTEMLEQELRMLSDYGIDMFGIFDDRELDFLMDDLGEIDLGAIADDLSAEVEEKAAETREAIEEADEKAVFLHEIFGSKAVTTKDARILSLFLAQLESEHSSKGMEALISHALSFSKTK